MFFMLFYMIVLEFVDECLAEYHLFASLIELILAGDFVCVCAFRSGVSCLCVFVCQSLTIVWNVHDICSFDINKDEYIK